MAIKGTVRVTCPSCQAAHEVQLVQSINAQTEPATKQQLLDGALNVLACECGKRTQLGATLVYIDSTRELYLQVVPPGGDVAAAAAAFAASGASGTLRIVPSQNALVEKVKIADAGLADWAVEMTKVLLLAAETDELDAILLFDGVDEAARLIQWVRIEDGVPRHVASAMAAYEKLAAREASRPARSELQIDRKWAVEAVQAMIASAN